MDNTAQLINDIKSLKIQGATSVAFATLEGIEHEIGSLPKDNNFHEDLLKTANELAYARENEPMAQNAVKYVFFEKNRQPEYYLQKVKEFRKLIFSAKEKMVSFSEELIKDGGTYMTHCHSSSVVEAFVKARKNGKTFKVYVSETRPRFQGRITAQELKDAEIEVIFSVDSAQTAILENKKSSIDAVFIGADLITNRGFINKVGSLSLVRACQRTATPLYSSCLLLKYYPGNFGCSDIEQREREEVWPEAPGRVRIFNPAFDYVPFSDAVKVITEDGIISGFEVVDKVKGLYTFIN